jgi:tetratricopeptide (TPR) repeat protein
LPLDREDTLKKAEKLLRQGRLDAAIAEYVRVIEDQPKDWNTANTLGDLYVRAGQTQNAAAQYSRIADHFMREGFYSKAAALYKKILKITPDNENTQLQLAELSVRQGLLADAKSYLGAVAANRRARGDRRGADEIVIRLGEVDPADFDARLGAARAAADSGDAAAAAARYRQLYGDLLEKGRSADAIAALRQAVRFNPDDREGRAVLAREAVEVGDLATARSYLDSATAGNDPELLTALVDIELRAGRMEAARELLPRLLALDRRLREKVIELAWALASTERDAAFVCVEAVVDASVESSDYADAAAALQEYIARVPAQIPALLRLVEVCVDGGLEATMYDAQAQLADAYLAIGQAAEARVIAEDLVAREPWEQAHIDRFRRALVMLDVPEPDSVIADRLSGQDAFMATDHFSQFGEPADARADVAQPAAVPVSVIEEEKPPAAPPPPTPQPPGRRRPASMEIDLSGALEEYASADTEPAPRRPAAPQNLEEVFQDFRKEVTRQGGPDDSAQHIALAETYLEMGMPDDAIESLKAAARSPRQRFEAGVRLATLFKARGDLTQAIEWMERAAEAPAPSPDAGLSLLYELGATLEAAGETARALAVFLELQADASGYRDVDARVDRLSRVQTGG